jgi:hypothetical protein
MKPVLLAILAMVALACECDAANLLYSPPDSPAIFAGWQDPAVLPPRYRNHCGTIDGRYTCANHCGSGYEFYYCSAAAFGCCRSGFGYCDGQGRVRCGP